MASTVAIVGFLLAAYSIVANDAIQTLGTFLSSNSKRPWWILWAFACTVLLFVFVYGWIVNDGDVSFGRLSKFPEPTGGLTWLHAIPPLVILLLTRFGIPVSTTFLVLAVFAPTNMGAMLTKSLVGYVLSFLVGIGVYTLISKSFEKQMIDSCDKPPSSRWILLQWTSTAFLWSQWLMHDLANIFVYLPRHLNSAYFFFATIVMLFLHAIIFSRRGGEIQHIVTTKTNTQDIRSATIIDFIYGLILLYFKEYSNMPMSTTWVFLGLLAGREVAMSLLLRCRPLKEASGIVFSDAGKAMTGLIVSVVLAFGMPVLLATFGTTSADATSTSNQPEPLTKDSIAILPPYETEAGVTGLVRCAGSDTLRIVFERVQSELAEVQPGLELAIESAGTETAPGALISGKCELALMSRRMTSAERLAFRNEFSENPVEYRIGLDALAVFVNQSNPIEGLTLAQIRDIYGTESESWGDYVLPPFPNKPIVTYGRNENSGTRTFFHDVVMQRESFRSDLIDDEDSAAVVDAVGRDEFGIGFCGMGYRIPAVKSIAIAPHEDGQYLNYFVDDYKDSPDLAKRFKNVYTGEYPLSRMLFVYARKPAGETLPPPVNAVMKFILSQQGQHAVLDSGFVPLTDELLNRQLRKLSAEYVPEWYE
ncbi:substrate-binding domain-containing protein [Thalassoglobus sp. JC818]|uniref:substrate-binding domain-containing protein n=1 Tax=Thalassoglobus sp. JC818 TaxID=3232136 RepID=UPI00345A0EFA